MAHGPKPDRKNFVHVHVRSLQVKMDFHLPAIPQFNPNGDPSSLGQRWNKWKKSFEYYLQAAAITDKARQRPLLLHLVGPETQEIFETFSETGDDLKTALTKLDSYFSPKKNIPFERHIS